MRNETLENYIETIDELKRNEGKARTTEIAQELRVKEPSVTEMLQKLKEEGFIKHEPYQGADLTKKGEKLADELREKHLTLAEFLKILGVDEQVSDRDACKIEHVVGEETIESLRNFIKFVEKCPEEPIWLGHYKYFVENDEHPECDLRQST